MSRWRLISAIAASVSIASTARSQVVKIWPGVAPGSEHWTQKERTIENTPVGTVVMNVVTPTLTAYLPDPAKATGTGVIIAPGGAFVALTMSLEDADLAHWLQQRGIAAFLLKYRLVEKRGNGIPEMNMDTAGRYGMADGIRALLVVRQHAKEWGVAPNHLGFIGFSAGAIRDDRRAVEPRSGGGLPPRTARALFSRPRLSRIDNAPGRGPDGTAVADTH